MVNRLRQRNEAGFTFVEVMAVILVVAIIIGVAAYIVSRHYSQAVTKDQGKSLSFDTPVSGSVGPACAFPTSQGCFEPTDSQYSTLNDIGSQGYWTAHIEGKGYIDTETLHGSAVGGPGAKYKVVHITRLDSAKGVGTKTKD